VGWVSGVEGSGGCEDRRFRIWHTAGLRHGGKPYSVGFHTDCSTRAQELADCPRGHPVAERTHAHTHTHTHSHTHSHTLFLPDQYPLVAGAGRDHLPELRVGPRKLQHRACVRLEQVHPARARHTRTCPHSVQG
jgi:hypothetical protein